MHKVLLKLEYWAPSRLSFPRRALRKHDAAMARRMASIEYYGFRIPLLTSARGEIIDGALRLKAARKLGFSEVPVIVCDDWTPEQVRAFRLLANRSFDWSGWDLDAVAEELTELSALHSI
jgi:ParB-like chromosome segregation protein Spo0J